MNSYVKSIKGVLKLVIILWALKAGFIGGCAIADEIVGKM